jgi:myo-inositol 2-dehydrogenase / D-chiro-inositol 1-dehydrogenase
MSGLTRRQFLGTAAFGGIGLCALRSLPAAAFLRRKLPLERIQVAQIGCGRMGRVDVQGVMKLPLARVVAVCDLDSKRLAAGRDLVTEFYRKQGESTVEVAAVHDYHELLARPDVDAVVVTVPDHWHALVAVEAALAGKHVHVQKPVTYDVAEAIALRKAVRARKIVLQTGSQQRSTSPWPAFRIASELVRNGRVGRLARIEIGLGSDQPSGKPPLEMPVPANLDYDRWLGPAPQQPYMEGRVHPQTSLSGRPGWITTEDFGLGMITNWGAHHVDIAQWAMGAELGGPVTIEGRADFMTGDLWTVHRGYHVELAYENRVVVVLDDHFEVGLRFIGDEGSIFCTRDAEPVTASDPKAAAPEKRLEPLRASDKKLLEPLPAGALRWAPSDNHYLNWLEAIRDRKDPIAPIDQSARSLTACYLAWLAMKLGRKLAWDPARERFVGDEAADRRLSRTPRRGDFDVAAVMKRAGLG